MGSNLAGVLEAILVIAEQTGASPDLIAAIERVQAVVMGKKKLPAVATSREQSPKE